jgi:hypothetical protein
LNYLATHLPDDDEESPTTRSDPTKVCDGLVVMGRRSDDM